MTVFLVIVALLLLGILLNISGVNQLLADISGKKEVNDAIKQEAEEAGTYLNAALGLIILALLGSAYYFMQGTVYEGHFFEWMNILVRWAHITFGIAWIGASFYFVFLENSLNRKEGLRDEIAGDLWAVHGGGFYYLEKYKVAPKELPKKLHWFKYEAYFTWLSGFFLLWVVYYFNAEGVLIDKNVLDIPAAWAVALGVGSLLLGWLIYDILCKSPLLKNGRAFFIIFFLILLAFAWFYTQVFSARAAYIHVGALIGTLMVGNVFFVIIPTQKAMVAAAEKKLAPDPWLGKYAGMRSYHNNYFTLPVLFIMISNHFPSTFGNEYNWIILGLISLGSAAFKHYLNLREKGEYATYVIPISIVLILSATYMTAPTPSKEKCDSIVTFDEIYPIFVERCVSCHSSAPTDDFYTAPPNGIVYDTPEDIAKLSDKIMQRVVVTKTMPQNNKTNMTPDERLLVKCWIEQGSNLK